MSDFLRDLVGRTLGVRDVLRPRPGSALERSDASRPRSSREPRALERVDDAVTPTPRSETRERRSQPVPASPRDPAPEPVAGRSSEPAATTIPIVHPAEPVAAAAARAPRPTPLEPRTRQTAEPDVREPPRRGPEGMPEPPTEVVTAAPPAASARATPRVAEPPEPAEPAKPTAAVTAARVVDTRVVERTVAPRERTVAQGDAPAPTPRVRRRAAEPPAAEREQEPVVHVHIGRIEVRAPAAPARPQAPRSREPLLSLADYLARTSARRT
jgi:hypothetical protein